MKQYFLIASSVLFLFSCGKDLQVKDTPLPPDGDPGKVMNEKIVEVSKHYQTDPNATGSLSPNTLPPPVSNNDAFSGSYDPASIPGGPLKYPGGSKE